MNGPVKFQSKIWDVSLRENVKILEPVNVYQGSIFGHSFIGPFCEIQNNIGIVMHFKTQPHTFICVFVEIDDFSFIGHGVMFNNNLFKVRRTAKGG